MTKTLEKRTLKKARNRQAIPEVMINDAPVQFTDGNWPVGSAAHQGDLMLVRIEALPKGAKLRESKQLADGDTQGSRHILEVGEPFQCDPSLVVMAIKAVCPKSIVTEKYIGPVFKTVKGTAALRHPEHGDHEYEGDMVVAVVVQRNLDAEQREVRTQD